MNVGEIIKKRRKELGLSAEEVANELNVDRSTVYRYESQDIEKLPTTILEKLAVVLNVSPAILMGWEKELPNVRPLGPLHKVPIIGSVMAGYDGLAIEEIKGYDYINVHNPEECVLFEVTGDSMEPKISHGDYALVRKQPDIESGELAIVIISGEVGTIKRVIKKDGAMMLQPFNANYPTLMFVGKQLDEVRIYGKVLKTEKHW